MREESSTTPKARDRLAMADLGGAYTTSSPSPPFPLLRVPPHPFSTPPILPPGKAPPRTQESPPPLPLDPGHGTVESNDMRNPLDYKPSLRSSFSQTEGPTLINQSLSVAQHSHMEPNPVLQLQRLPTIYNDPERIVMPSNDTVEKRGTRTLFTKEDIAKLPRVSRILVGLGEREQYDRGESEWHGRLHGRR